MELSGPRWPSIVFLSWHQCKLFFHLVWISILFPFWIQL
jgi:hypothetical protein